MSARSGRPADPRVLARRSLQALDSFSYDFARARYRRRRSAIADDRPVLVYTPGKVGSSAVAASLAAGVAPRQVAHLHYLTNERLTRDDALFRQRARTYRGTARARRFLPYYVWLGELIQQAVLDAPGKTWDVVTMVRDPMERNVSAFFQNLETTDDLWVSDLLLTQSSEQIADDLVARFLSAYVDRGHPLSDADPLTWFDDEMLLVFGIDVFGTEFEHARGYQIYRSTTARLLLIRLEDLSSVARTAFSDFLDVDAEVDPRQNSADSKSYGDVYARFKERLVVPAHYLDRLYASRYSRHFYTEQELESFRRRWAR